MHGDLTTAYCALNWAETDIASFHDSAGEWLELVAAAPPAADEPRVPITPAEVRQHQTGLDEVWRRAARAGWAASPWRDRLSITVADFLARSPAEWQQALDEIATAAQAADGFADEQLLPLDEKTPAAEQATARRELARLLDELGVRGMPALCSRLADASGDEVASLAQERQGLAAMMTEIATEPLDVELIHLL